MNYQKMAKYHWEKQAEITVAVQPVSKKEASRFGLLKRNRDGRILDFFEKPKDPTVLADFASRADPEKPYLGSMGIYLFNSNALIEILRNTTDDDFGGEVIPKAIATRSVFGFDFQGYWEDIGTIRSFYETNLQLTRADSPFNIYNPDQPLFTRARYLPGSIINGAKLNNVLLADGCRLENANIKDSVIGLRAQVADGAKIRRTIMMGGDYYVDQHLTTPAEVPMGIGPNCDIEGAILDKNVRIGEGVVIRPFPQGTEINGEDYFVRDGIVVIPKNTVLQPHRYIGPKSKEK